MALNNLGQKYMFPWREGNSFRILVDGNIFLPRMLQEIQQANHYILLEMYLFESGHVASEFIDALASASRRGVRIYLILDHFGTRGLSHYDKQQLREAGINISYFNRPHLGKILKYAVRDHRKLLIIDGKTAYVGGTGITDDFNPPSHPEKCWHEFMVEIQGTVLRDWQKLFRQTWHMACNRDLQLPRIRRHKKEDDQLGRVVSINGLRSREIIYSLIRHIRQAEHRVWLATAYFEPSWRIRRALRYACRQGCDVRLLLPGPLTDHPGVRLAGRRYYQDLLDSGIRIFEYRPRVQHGKMMLCDNWVSIGSSNLDRWNLRWNLEANQEIDDQYIAEQVQEILEKDFLASDEQFYEEWIKRPWHGRVWEYFYGLIERFLIRFRRYYRKKK
jgi:cardiolipin synthase